MDELDRDLLLWHAAGILQAKLSNPTTTQLTTPDSLLRSSVKLAYKLINTVNNDEALNKILTE